MSSSNYYRSWIDRPHLDSNTRLLTEEYQRGITEFMGLVQRQPEAETVTVTSLNPRGRVQGSSELEDPLQPSTSGNLSAAEDLAAVGLVVDLTDFGEEAVVHVEDEPEFL
ncbi:hypothetical protein IGI04_019765 [Brassica rapa subsp. trilocularis]|uniref:Uncharacterized protein n=1 Tax=Brassica rapa subsp. trilocularis TaxID=1813537 RepID=A0ABQ7MGS6_BRACM|nr:hypothetical protein IGI04_019765 [Brassica rapa subsp. trilocularis]